MTQAAPLILSLAPPQSPDYIVASYTMPILYRCLIRHAQVKYPWFMSPSAAAFLSALLEPNPIKRLGAGPTGIEDIKSHPFMEGGVYSTDS